MPYMSGTNTETTAQSFTLCFKVNNNLRAGIFQENGTTQLTQAAAQGSAAYTATALSLEYSAYKSVVDAIIGLNIGTLNSQGVAVGTSTIAAGSYTLSDIYAKVSYNASKTAFLNLKMGYRMLPISDTGATSAFTSQNAPFFKIGVGVKF